MDHGEGYAHGGFAGARPRWPAHGEVARGGTVELGLRVPTARVVLWPRRGARRARGVLRKLSVYKN